MANPRRIDGQTLKGLRIGLDQIRECRPYTKRLKGKLPLLLISLAKKIPQFSGNTTKISPILYKNINNSMYSFAILELHNCGYLLCLLKYLRCQVLLIWIFDIMQMLFVLGNSLPSGLQYTFKLNYIHLVKRKGNGNETKYSK